MRKIALVTDSTADLTSMMKQESEAHIIPLKVRFGEEEYLDTDFSEDQFYQRLAIVKALPKTSQPSPEEFQTLYRRLLGDYQEIISIHLSSGLSGTLNAARLAAETLRGAVHIVDSKTISLGLGLLVMETARHIKEGFGATQIVKTLAQARENVETMFTLNTLEYLQKGGRLGRVQSLMGSILNIKPLIRVGDDGIYHTYDKSRSQERAFKSMAHGFRDLARGRRPIKLAVAHAAAHQGAARLKEILENAFQIPASICAQVSPVIGVHSGPGTVGAAMQFES